MRTYTLKCDRCKKEETLEDVSKSKLELLKVGVAVEKDQRYSHYYYNNIPLAEIHNPQEWCITCRKELNLCYRTDEERKAMPVPTTEEQLIEVMRCFVEKNTPQPNQ